MKPNDPVDFFAAEQQKAMVPAPETNTGPLARLGSRWQPHPLVVPAVDPELPALPAPSRCAEVLRYSVLRAEFWLSPGGSLREWLRLNVWLACVLAMWAYPRHYPWLLLVGRSFARVIPDIAGVRRQSSDRMT